MPKTRPVQEEYQDEYEKEYGTMATIYIDKQALARLNEDEDFGKWYEPCQYATSPTAVFCIKTSVPQESLENGMFHPDRFEPEITVERCEEVSAREISKAAKNDPQQQRVKKLKNLKSGQRFIYKNSGFGTVSYEEGDTQVWRKGGKLFTYTFDSAGMTWTGETWKFDSGMGLVTYIVLPEDVPEEMLATGWQDTPPPKRKVKPITLRYLIDGHYGKGDFVWSDREKTWTEVTDDQDGIALYEEDGYEVVGWK